jgi:hypothetical protein
VGRSSGGEEEEEEEKGSAQEVGAGTGYLNHEL